MVHAIPRKNTAIKLEVKKTSGYNPLNSYKVQVSGFLESGGQTWVYFLVKKKLQAQDPALSFIESNTSSSAH